MKNHSVPMRRCVGCMTSYPKKELVRFVLADGRLQVCESGKENGRGVYLCRSLDCFVKAVKRKKISNDLMDEFEKVLKSVEVNV
ncbi:hypothetical protein AGMMS49983_17580 [Clostridia bacterium]|nr:hypothetical protein AGMMS49983_17580 [Clostridia bacterium]